VNDIEAQNITSDYCTLPVKKEKVMVHVENSKICSRVIIILSIYLSSEKP